MSKSKYSQFLIAAVALMAACCPLSAQPAGGAKVGVLTCRTSASLGLLLGSHQKIRCSFRPDNGAPADHYEGHINRLGVDIGVSDPATRLAKILAVLLRLFVRVVGVNELVYGRGVVQPGNWQRNTADELSLGPAVWYPLAAVIDVGPVDDRPLLLPAVSLRTRRGPEQVVRRSVLLDYDNDVLKGPGGNGLGSGRRRHVRHEKNHSREREDC